MGTKLYVGNLSYDATQNDLQDLFAQAGAVTSVNLMQDRETGRPRGFDSSTVLLSGWPIEMDLLQEYAPKAAVQTA